MDTTPKDSTPTAGAPLSDLLDAALNTLEEGFAVLDASAKVVAWNPVATAITGFQRAEMLGRPLPESLYENDQHASDPWEIARFRIDKPEERPMAVKLRHAQGHSLPAMLWLTPLRDDLGHRCGTVLRFHPTEEVDALPHGAMDEEEELDHHVEHNRGSLQERLDEAWQEWRNAAVPFGLLWVLVDQAEMLRKTHGRDASEAMLAIVERTLSHALRPAEILGQWGGHEFLVLSHERTPALLLLHARHVCELAHSADFRWWGDRVPLTVSIGCAQAGSDEKLSGLLLRAQESMQRARLDGGNMAVLNGDERILTQDGR
jgi:diguanylate cyclase (GGDEF)-like protein/PAS domain S-box-containing protein